MTKQLLGKEVTAVLNEQIRKRAEKCRESGVIPTLAIIRVGEDEGDISYEKGAARRCELLGVECRKWIFPADVTTEELLAVIRELNTDPKIHGVLLLRPLPKTVDSRKIENALCAEKDVDCMTDLSQAGVYMGNTVGFPPCTPEACIQILDHYGIDCTGKRAVVIGRSLVVGRPAAMMLLKKNATVTICHTKTKNLPEEAGRADILIAAAGQAEFVDKRFLKEGQIILDVGIHVKEDGKLCGDVKYEDAEGTAEAVTPVPGGVGSVTTSILVRHVVEAAERACVFQGNAD